MEVVSNHVAELNHLLSNMITHPVMDLAKHLACFLHKSLEKSFFLNTSKFEVVAFAASYHGLTQGAGSMTYSAGHR